MRLPHYEQAVISDEKIVNYLLSSTHPVGQFKAKFFRTLGYGADNWEQFKNDIKALLVNDAILKEKTEFGQKYEVAGMVRGPLKTANIVTVWIILNDDELPRFITAHPGERK